MLFSNPCFRGLSNAKFSSPEVFFSWEKKTQRTALFSLAMKKELFVYDGDFWIVDEDQYPLQWQKLTGQSNRSEIESYFVIESNVFAQIESNRIQIESNDFFDFRYDSIRFWLKAELEKLSIVTEKKRKIHKTESWRGLSDIDAFIMHNFLKIGHFPNRQYSFMTTDAFSYRIESKSNRIECFQQLPDQKSNRIETDSIWQPWKLIYPKKPFD